MKDKISTLFVGVDTHKETHTLVGTNIVCEPLCKLTFNNDLDGFREAFKRIKETAQRQGFTPLIGLEDSSSNGAGFARFLLRNGLSIKTVNPVLVDRNRKYNTHPEKSDSRDALGVAEVLVRRTDRLPDYTLTQNTEFANSVAVLVKDREELVGEQTKLKNKLHAGLGRLWGRSYKDVYQKDIFGKRALKFWDRYPSAQDFKKTTRPLKSKPRWITSTNINDLPFVSDIDRQHIRRLVKRLEITREQLAEIEAELKSLSKERYDYLLSLSGCGSVTASKFIAYVKDINRFPSEKQLAKFAGIAPRKYESGNIKRDKSSVRGHSALRRAFKTVALSQIGRRGNQKAKEYYRKKLKEGKSKKQALKCLMRQNVKIVWRIMKEQRPYY